MTADGKKITLKLMVDKVKKRVLFAEADIDFVDILFSFLTLPLGTIIRVLGKQSIRGSISNLYESVENLDTNHMQTEACKTMLLCPQSAAALCCEDLKFNVDDTEPKKVFCCSKPGCRVKPVHLGSSVANARCPHCHQLMDYVRYWPKSDKDANGVFIKGGERFMISDDLHVNHASLTHSLSLLQKLGIEDDTVLEEITKDIGQKEILNLLQRSLISDAPLTETFINSMGITDVASAGTALLNLVQIKSEGDIVIDETGKRVTIKLLVAENKLICAEGGEDFADMLLSFLTLPLGSVIKFLDRNSCMGCVDNLYKSVQALSLLDYIKSDECEGMLLSPKLAPYFGCDNNLLKMDEVPPRQGFLNANCYTCYWNKDAKCKHGVDKSSFNYMNPKSPTGKREVGGGYAKGPGKFIVTDDLHISHLSPLSISRVISHQGSPISKLVVAEAKIDRAQVLKLLKAALLSKTSLTDVFHAKSKGQR